MLLYVIRGRIKHADFPQLFLVRLTWIHHGIARTKIFQWDESSPLQVPYFLGLFFRPKGIYTQNMA